MRLGGMLPGTRVIDTSSSDALLNISVKVRYFFSVPILPFEKQNNKLFGWCRIEVLSM